MANNAAETVIGAVVLAVAGGFMFFAAQSANLSATSTYELTAQFRKADGVNVGGDVRIAGVKVGSVRAMTLNPDTFQAEVRMAVRRDVMVPDDSAATIASDGLLGGAHIAIQPGGSEFMIAPGGAFTITQSSISILDLVGRAITGGGE
ncbi:MAG: outer membrane lipid asymmetry maintenance protein MlaD [Alphaproteobacteria bacterium HGW-Alphaproteobacteria-8]|nr:MAG: outer membrane lipid asymmetry maintenance protein MlaD [Alphaproteobacteria bacterium HGW-Alphaproteobacteria-8]